MSAPKPNPFRDTPFPAAGGEYRADDGELTPDAPASAQTEKLIGLGALCDAHDAAEAAEAAEAAADPTPPRPARTRRNPAEQE